MTGFQVANAVQGFAMYCGKLALMNKVAHRSNMYQEQVTSSCFMLVNVVDLLCTVGKLCGCFHSHASSISFDVRFVAC